LHNILCTQGHYQGQFVLDKKGLLLLQERPLKKDHPKKVRGGSKSQSEKIFLPKIFAEISGTNLKAVLSNDGQRIQHNNPMQELRSKLLIVILHVINKAIHLHYSLLTSKPLIVS
jgi:hypothetical protein